MAMKEFGLSNPHALCEVTFATNSLTRTRTLADHLTDLSARIPINARSVRTDAREDHFFFIYQLLVASFSRYYLKSHMASTFSFPEEIINLVLKESSVSLLELPALELATQLTLRAFRLLKAVRSSDHICDLFGKHRTKASKENVERFSQVSVEPRVIRVVLFMGN